MPIPAFSGRMRQGGPSHEDSVSDPREHQLIVELGVPAGPSPVVGVSLCFGHGGL
jgi:hypothetical protein